MALQTQPVRMHSTHFVVITQGAFIAFVYMVPQIINLKAK
jgi:hypothetical protein